MFLSFLLLCMVVRSSSGMLVNEFMSQLIVMLQQNVIQFRERYKFTWLGWVWIACIFHNVRTKYICILFFRRKLGPLYPIIEGLHRLYWQVYEQEGRKLKNFTVHSVSSGCKGQFGSSSKNLVAPKSLHQDKMLIFKRASKTHWQKQNQESL